MSLSLYNKKRNFKETPEPSGKAKSSASKLTFVIQRHKASHLHYDFRLEIGGTLKSWAIPKGPSLNPQDKRLAMMVEDHPYNYKDFTGVIPEGNYGAGIVEIWDKGYFSDLDNSGKETAEKKLKAGLHAGNLKFRLYGKKLKGEFALVKLKNGKQENAWLLIKHKDEYATREEYNSEEHTLKNSPINKWLASTGSATKKGTAKKVASRASATQTVATKKSAAKKAKAPLKKKAVRKYLPGKTRKLEQFIAPMLAKETDTPFNDAGWIYEIKWDGYRAIAEVNKDDVLLYSRNGNTFNDSYPAVVDALSTLKINAVLDGEVIVVNESGKSDFQLLQHYEASYPLEYRVFDVLSINGKDVCHLPLTERKALLEKLLPKNPVVKYSEHIEKTGVDFFNAAVKNDLEGIMAKKADSEYITGLRTNDWLKIKHHKSQEVIIAGFTEPTGSRKYFGALVLGIKKGKELVYAGHTGGGFNHKSLKEMYELLQPLIQEQSPFKEKVKTNTPVTWVKPVMVCEIKFSEITTDGRMRHPIFLRLRDDKQVKDLNMEDREKVSKAASSKRKGARGAKRAATGDRRAPVGGKKVATDDLRAPVGGKKAATDDRRAPMDGKKVATDDPWAPVDGKKAATDHLWAPMDGKKVATGDRRASTDGRRSAVASKKGATGNKKETARSRKTTTGTKQEEGASRATLKVDEEGMLAFGKTKVKVTNLHKVYFPDDGVTKGDVISYYISVSKYILPYLKDRPESLKRNPNGIKDFGFFHKDAGDEAPAWVKSKAIFSESTNKDIDYILCNDQPTLTYLNNLGCIEINPWHSTIAALDKPDYMIIDIDPSKKNTFEQVIETANVVHEVLEQTGAESYCKTSGATGLHVYVPTGKKYTYDQLKDFAHLICMLVQEQLPEFTSLERNLKKRGDKMIYLDHLQNRKGQTISSVYSLRPQPGATVSMPLKWAEVKSGLSPLQFTIHNALKRIEKMDGYFKAVLGKGIDLKKCLAGLEKISG